MALIAEVIAPFPANDDEALATEVLGTVIWLEEIPVALAVPVAIEVVEVIVEQTLSTVPLHSLLRYQPARHGVQGMHDEPPLPK